MNVLQKGGIILSGGIVFLHLFFVASKLRNDCRVIIR